MCCIESAGIGMFMPACWSGCWIEVGDCACAPEHRMQASPAANYLGGTDDLPFAQMTADKTCRETSARTSEQIVEEDYSPASSRSFLSVGLCLSALSFRFLLDGSARVGGGVPSASRAAASTAEAARNGLALGILEGIVRSFPVESLSAVQGLPRDSAEGGGGRVKNSSPAARL